jgi:acetyltransferase-like isoleucine patch superfamily enzyme
VTGAPDAPTPDGGSAGTWHGARGARGARGRFGAPPVRGALGRTVAEVVRRAWEWSAFAAAIGPGSARARRFAAFGRGSMIAFPPGAIYNEAAIALGEETMIGPHVSLTAGMAPGQALLTSPVVRIGDRCVIGRGSHIVGHWSIDIGDDVQTGPYVYVTDQNHAYEDPDLPIGRQWPIEAGVSIGAGSWLGANAVVLPGAQIGRHVVVAAGAVVRGTVPDHTVVAGVPARVVRRWTAEHGWMDAAGRAAQGPA